MPRGGSNYMPRPDGNFDAWVRNYYSSLKLWWDMQGLGKHDLDALQEALNAWTDAYPAHVAAQAAADAATQAKLDARAALERAVRPITNFVQSYPATTDAARATIGLTVRDTGRRPVPPPASTPAAQVDGGERLTHRLRITDDAAPTRRGKPPGTIGAEVWMTLVDAGAPVPTNPAALSFLTLTSRATVRAEFKPADGGKTAVYMLRWVSTRGEKGPWGEFFSATVAA